MFTSGEIHGADYFYADQALEMVLRAGSDLEDEDRVADDFDDRESYIPWHVVPFFRETEVFLKDGFNLCRHVTGLRC